MKSTSETTGHSTRIAHRGQSKRPASILGTEVESGPTRKRILVPRNFLRTILVPVDFSGFTEAAIQAALLLAQPFEAKITLLHVVDRHTLSELETPFNMKTFLRQTEQRALERLNVIQNRIGTDADAIEEVRVLVGKPFEEITNFARGMRMDLILMPTHGRTGIKHILMGSTTEKVVRHAHCPVLVIRGKNLGIKSPPAMKIASQII